MARNHNQYVEAIKEGILRDAEALVAEHPLMVVHGTPFETGNMMATPASGPMDDDGPGGLGASRKSFRLDGSVTEQTITPPALVARKSFTGLNSSSSSTTTTPSAGATSQLKLGHIMKRAIPLKASSMWSTAVTGSVYFAELAERFRFARLRKKLEQHLLPTLLQRRLKTLLVSDVRTENTNTAGESDGNAAADRPTAHIISQCCPWLGALNDMEFLEEIAGAMQKLTKLTGDDIVKAGDSSQGVLYVLLTGRYEWMNTSVTPPVGEKVTAPIALGNTFGGPSKYARSMFARSKGIVWYISRSTLEGILENWVRAQTHELYAQQVKQEMLESMSDNFPLAPSRIALLRRMPSNLVATYFENFEPVVLNKGAVLFEEGTSAGTVFVVCDGVLNRSRRPRVDDSGFSQFITVRTGVTTRFALFGEEPHILPEKHRFTCSVFSDVMKGYRIPARMFTSMLLDDPTLLLQLRQDILTQRAKMMRIKAEALKQVPILADFPIQRLHSLIQVMTPKVYERSQFLCQSQQTLREIYVVIRGDVRDPRAPGVLPPVVAPPKVTAAPHPTIGGLGQHTSSFVGSVKEKERVITTDDIPDRTIGFERGQSFSGERSMARFTAVARGVATISRAGSLFTPSHPTVGSGLPNEIALQDDQDLSPPIPMATESRIQYALGGGWEGLLQEKWQRGWEAMNVVEAWVLPTAAIRNEYNELSRHLQATILNTARVNQMKELGLDGPQSTKLPPMSFYRSGTTGASAAGGGGSVSDGESSRRASQSRKGRSKAKFRLSGAAPATGDSESSMFESEASATEGSVCLDSKKSSSQPRNKKRLVHLDQNLPKERGTSPGDKAGNHETNTAAPRNTSPASKGANQTKKAKKKKPGEPPKLGAIPTGSITFPTYEDEELATMRKLAQERNEHQQAMRLLPLEEVIRRETKRLVRGEHRHQTMLPPLSTREDVLYFCRGEDNAPARSPPSRSLAQPVGAEGGKSGTSVVDDETMQRRQLLFGGHEAVDPETGLMQQDRVIRAPQPPSVGAASARAAQRTKHQSWDNDTSPLPNGLLLMLKHNGAGASSSRATQSEKTVSARVPPPHRPAVASADRRWFHHIPDTAPPVKCSSLDQKFHGTEPFDVMLVQMLRMAEDAGVLRGKGIHSPRKAS